MTEPTTADVLAGIVATREADQATRLAQLLKATTNWLGFLTLAIGPWALVVAVIIWGRR